MLTLPSAIPQGHTCDQNRLNIISWI